VVSALFSVGEVPAADRLDVIEGFASATWVPMECRSEFRADYRGEFHVSGLGATRVVVLDIMPITVRRTSKLISQADPDMLKLVLVCGRGCSVVEQDGRQARLSASDFALPGDHHRARRPWTQRPIGLSRRRDPAVRRRRQPRQSECATLRPDRQRMA
jgi:hypothetical protein